MLASYEHTFNERALYLPAISYTYATFVQSNVPIRDTGLTARDLDFFNPRSRLFYYPYGLLSAGQVRQLTDHARPPVMQRDRTATVLLGDSGGFQVQNNRLPFDPATTPVDVLRWLETNATYSMGLDFPTGGLESGNMVAHRERLELDPTNRQRIADLCQQNRQSRDFNAALLQTMLNNDIMLQARRPGATKLLNVLQGRTEAESKAWFEAVKHYPFEGWAFAGGNVRNFALLIRRLLEMRDAGMLDSCPWLHILGISRPETAVLYTLLQRKLRQQCGNPALQISFDSASPFHVASLHEAYSGFIIDKTGWRPRSTKVVYPRLPTPTRLTERLYPDHPVGQYRGLSQIGRIVTDHDVIIKPIVFDDDGTLESRSGWDAISSYIVMNHNVQVMLEAMKYGHQAYDEGWENVPTSVIQIEIAINHLFDAADPYAEIDDWAPVLHYTTN